MDTDKDAPKDAVYVGRPSRYGGTFTTPVESRHGFARTVVVNGRDIGEAWVCDACWRTETQGHADHCPSAPQREDTP